MILNTQTSSITFKDTGESISTGSSPCFDVWLSRIVSPENYNDSKNRHTEVIPIDDAIDLTVYRGWLQTHSVGFNCGCIIDSEKLSIRFELLPTSASLESLQLFAAILESVTSFTFESDDRCHYHQDGRQYVETPLAQWDRDTMKWDRPNNDIQKDILDFLDSVFTDEAFSADNQSLMDISKL